MVLSSAVMSPLAVSVTSRGHAAGWKSPRVRMLVTSSVSNATNFFFFYVGKCIYAFSCPEGAGM
jgi:hypothetical protein